MKIRSIKLFNGTHANAAEAMAEFLKENRIDAAQVWDLACFELGGAIPTVTLNLQYTRREPNEELTGNAKVKYVLVGGGVGLREQEFEREVNKGLADIGPCLVHQTFTQNLNNQGFQTHMSWFAIYY